MNKSLVALAILVAAPAFGAQDPAPAAQAAPPMPAALASQPPPKPATLGLFVYPGSGQDAAKQNQDENECYLWARGQTGIDPTAAPTQAAPPDAPKGGAVKGAARGAAKGAAVGAVSDERHYGDEGSLDAGEGRGGRRRGRGRQGTKGAEEGRQAGRGPGEAGRTDPGRPGEGDLQEGLGSVPRGSQLQRQVGTGNENRKGEVHDENTCRNGSGVGGRRHRPGHGLCAGGAARRVAGPGGSRCAKGRAGHREGRPDGRTGQFRGAGRRRLAAGLLHGERGPRPRLPAAGGELDRPASHGRLRRGRLRGKGRHEARPRLPQARGGLEGRGLGAARQLLGPAGHRVQLPDAQEGGRAGGRGRDRQGDPRRGARHRPRPRPRVRGQEPDPPEERGRA